MGASGPCGPCTEIHVDHSDEYTDLRRRQFVNADRPDLTEIWNIVFIEYNRNIDGTITSLPQKHVDTGMGLERIVAHMQQKHSNYDTDLFMPIIEKINQVHGNMKIIKKFYLYFYIFRFPRWIHIKEHLVVTILHLNWTLPTECWPTIVA
jgi:alanyl-tRNA synthetase